MSVTELRPGVHVVDLGQNINGRVRLTDLGPAGTELVLTHAECARPGRRRDHRPPGAGPAVPARAADAPARSTGSSRPASTGDVFEPRFTTHGFQYVRIEGHPGPLTAGRRDRRRRAHRPRAARRVPLQRRADQPAARGGGVELPRQRLRRTDRLPHPRAGRLDRRLAAVRADRDVPLRRRRLLPEVAARPRRRRSGRTAPSATWRRCRPPSGPASWPPSTARPAGATRSCWCRGSCSRSTATRRCCATRGRRWCAGSTAPSGWPSTRGTRTGRRAPRAAAARAVPLGHRLPLGRVAGAGRGPGRLPGVHRGRQGRHRHRVLRLVDPARRRDRRG